MIEELEKDLGAVSIQSQERKEIWKKTKSQDNWQSFSLTWEL